MGVYFSQALTVTGDPAAVADFSERCVRKQDDVWIGLHLESVAPAPEGWPTRAAKDWPDDEVLEDFELGSASDTTLLMRFTTKGLPIGAAVRNFGVAFPTLDFRLACVDDSYEYPFVITAVGRNYRERRVRETVKLMNEILGERRDPTKFYKSDSPTYPLHIWQPHHFIRRAVLRRRITAYPVYRPPQLGLSRLMSDEQARANLDHFLATRRERREHLARFLKSFGVELDGSDAGLRRLDRWIARYGPFLPVKIFDESVDAHMPAWEGERVGFNVMLDLGSFLGDVIIERNPELGWGLFVGIRSSRRKDDHSFQRICVLPPGKSRHMVNPGEAVEHACIMLGHPMEFEGGRLKRDQKLVFRNAATRIVATAPAMVNGARYWTKI